MSAAPPFRFPYMFWARNESAISAYSLSQSGMPPPDASFLDGLGVDLAGPPAGALPELTERLAELFAVDPERVLVTLGASAGMHLAAARWLRAGSKVAAETPSYEPLRALPEYFGADVRPLERRFEDGWKLDPERVRSALAGGQGPGHVFMTNPHNPTGTRHTAAEMTALAAEAERAGGVLVCCEVYMEFLRNEERVHVFDLAPNTVTIGSLTKAYGLGALRVGWMILGEGVAKEKLALLDLSYLGYVDGPSVAMRAGRRCLDHLPQLLQPLKRVEVECRPAWERWLRETPGIEAIIPPRGIIAFPRIEGVSDTAGLVRYLQREHQVDVVPGEFFGKAGHLRVGCGVPAQTLIEGLERLGRGIEAWRARS